MGKVILAAVVTLICGYLGSVIGNELLGGFQELGSITAVAVMGVFIIFFNEKKK
ncbi:MAG: binding-protein-dependent transport permease [Ruminococcus sp.]|nr:binding-protein-dependent transport permease [Ruminococcus sp.]